MSKKSVIISKIFLYMLILYNMLTATFIYNLIYNKKKMLFV